ncbi:MAG TPA: DUF192 domain-containing protein [Rhodocyclaceae bacterium]|nr:DUF192 domain-containing protein [Rhodocyclaceae bacterium]
MKHGAIFHNGRCVLPKVKRTTNVWDRARGLLGRPRLETGEGLLIDPCPSVHTIGMGYPLDLVFLDADFRVLKLIDALPPLRFAGCRNARATLELAPGSLAALSLELGGRLEWQTV